MSDTSVKGRTEAIREAVAKTLTDGGVTTLPYDTWTVGSPARAALGALPEYGIAMHPQGGRITGITLPLYLYLPVTHDAARSIKAAEAAIEDVVDAIAADPTFGHQATGIGFPSGVGTELYRDENGAMLLVATIQLAITLH